MRGPADERTRVRKTILIATIAAALVFAALAAAGVLYLRGFGQGGRIDETTPVVLVFESPSEDAATAASLIALVANGTMQDVSPDTTVAVTGVPSKRLGDAFVFGGGPAVARSLSAMAGGRTPSYVVVPETTWAKAVAAKHGIEVDVPKDLSVFDGNRLTKLRAGQQSLEATGVSALLRGMSYLDPEQRSALSRALEAQLAAALVGEAAGSDAVHTDLSPKSVDLWFHSYLPRAGGS
jgi:hypothetical protein